MDPRMCSMKFLFMPQEQGGGCFVFAFGRSWKNEPADYSS